MKYIFLTNFIVEIGGAQQYVRNKLVELKRRGIDVFLFHAQRGSVYIEELKEYSSFFIPQLRYSPICFRKKEVTNVVEYIASVCGDIEEDSVIDASCITNLMWGEILAAKFHCKSVGFLVDERFKTTNEELAFLRFKHIRKEIAGTSKQSLRILFQKQYELTDDECYFFNPYCSNTVDNVENPNVKDIVEDNERIKIGCLGRLDKGYMLGALTEIADYVKRDLLHQYRIVVIGGGSDPKCQNRILKLFENIDNAKITITGLLFPIPRNLIQALNVCISSAASARVVANEGIPTVYVNVFNGRPVGIMNYTLSIQEDQTARYSENYIDMKNTLDEILFSDYCQTHRTISSISVDEVDRLMHDEINSQLQFIANEVDKKYYDVLSMRASSRQLQLFSFIGKMFGGKALYSLHVRIFSKLKGKLYN